MKRRALCLVLALTLLLALAPHALAEGSITRTAVWVTSPVGGEKPHAPQEVSVWLNGTKRVLTEGEEYSYFWREANGKTEFTGTFVNGRAYVIEITLLGLLTEYSLAEDAPLILNEADEPDATATLSVTETDSGSSCIYI